jgi:NAD(P)-dependent dehydrogenase (short-subunit alcohol dehydrogenase family)
MKPLAGRAALVTGGGRGVGRAIAMLLAAEGAAVGVNYRRDAEAAESLVAEIAAGGGQAVALRASLDSLDEVDALASSALAALGEVDILVCNAGIASRGLSVAETTAEEVQRVMAVHTLSAHRLVHLLLPAMRRAQRADVVVISSSELLQMRANGAPYNMAKAALEAFAITLAHEEAKHGVRVNIVAPGLVATEMGDRLVRATLGVEGVASLDQEQPFGRVCKPEDVAHVVRFLVSPDAALITGQRIVIDGGADALAAMHAKD